MPDELTSEEIERIAGRVAEQIARGCFPLIQPRLVDGKLMYVIPIKDPETSVPPHEDFEDPVFPPDPDLPDDYEDRLAVEQGMYAPGETLRENLDVDDEPSSGS